MNTSHIDWNAIRLFYTETRSLKLTAERFNVSINTIRTRSRREKWSQSDVQNEGAGGHRQGSNEHPSEDSCTSNVQKEGTDEHRRGVNEHPNEGFCTSDVQNEGAAEHRPDANEHPNGGFCPSDVQNEGPTTNAQKADVPPKGTESHTEGTRVPSPLFCLPNLSTAKIERLKPWGFRNGTTPQGMSKDEFREWCADVHTQDLFYSGFEGTNAALRVSDSNPATFMHALVVDYDARITPEERPAFIKRAKTTYPPNYISTTFSGGVRLVWLFEGPVPLFSKRINELFLLRLQKELKLKKMFPGIDEEALMRPIQYYHCGHNWEPLFSEPLSLDLLYSWAVAVSQKADWSGFGAEIPISRVVEEVEKRFPGRWPGLFEIGARGPRFWDDTASNPTAAIVRSSGMQCFTGSKPFVSWGEILGRKFVDEFQADTVGAAIRGIWFDGRDYWRKVEGVWRLFKKGDIALNLRVDHGISDERRRGVVATAMDQVLNQIHLRKIVDGAAPFVYRQDAVITFGGKRYLNIARSRLLTPAEGPQPWGERFPYFAALLDGYFDPPEQLPFFLSWLAYAFRNALAGRPRNGQAVFIAGDVNLGKTLLSNVPISDLLGGHMDASDYLLGESRFNKELFEVGLWTVDDTVPSSDPRKQQLYSAMLKKIPANYSFQYQAKFRDQIMLPWAGRVIITCNADPESIRILPDVEMSLLDKVMLFKVAKMERDFTDAADRIRAELPYFAGFLRDYEIPEQCQGNARFGVKCYHHSELLEEARQSGRTAGFAELLEIFRRSFFSHGGKDEWTGNATELKQAMLTDDAIRPLVDPYSVDQLGRLLGKLGAQNYPGLKRLPQRHTSRVWQITQIMEDSHVDCPF